jgi:hypothetical protein
LEDYVRYYTEEAPSYERLTVTGADAKWNLDYRNRNVRRRQADVLGTDGQPSGVKTWLLYVPFGELAQHSSYKKHQVGIEMQFNSAKNPGEAAKTMLVDKYTTKAQAILQNEDCSDLSYHNRWF